jgi:hypothetical protein
MNFETIKRNFDKGLWTAGMVKLAADKGVISPERYTEITGEEYEELTEGA